MAEVFAGMVLGWGVLGLLGAGPIGHRRFVPARAGGRSGAGAFTVYLVCGTAGLWVLATVVYFAIFGTP